MNNFTNERFNTSRTVFCNFLESVLVFWQPKGDDMFQVKIFNHVGRQDSTAGTVRMLVLRHLIAMSNANLN